jgi:hypothetical protein
MKPLRYLTIKVFSPGNRKHKTFMIKCPPGSHLKADGEDEVLKQFADRIERTWPHEEYAVREVGRGAWNFVWVRSTPVDDAELRIGGMKLGEVASVEVGA